jgi:SAM-dependent methyltransferase
MVAVLSDKREFIIAAVKVMYTDVARNPDKEFHFPTGRAACRFVGYPDQLLDQIPTSTLESFAGVGYPHAANVIKPGDTVLDIGAGSGTDTLIAGLAVGQDGHVHGLDMTPAMLKKQQANIDSCGADNVSTLPGEAENIPLPDQSVDVVTSNGVLNLVPDKAKCFAEIYRVLKPGGKVQLADIVVDKAISDKCKSDPELWAECVVGASLMDQYVALFADVGFTDITEIRSFDYFAGSNSEKTRKVASGFAAHTIELVMTKPA